MTTIFTNYDGIVTTFLTMSDRLIILFVNTRSKIKSFYKIIFDSEDMSFEIIFEF